MYIGSKNVAYSRARMRFSLETSEPNLLSGDFFSLSIEFSVEERREEHVLKVEKEGIEVNDVAGDSSVTA